MAKYRVDVGYKTKREAISLGMEIEAFNDTEAGEIAEAKVLKGYPARKWVFTRVSEARTPPNCKRRPAGFPTGRPISALPASSPAS
jgi:hypothetical protein